jgi:hypothetical protein
MSNETDETPLVRYVETAEEALAQESLKELLSFGKRVDLPTTGRRCGYANHRIQEWNQETEARRQAELASLGKTEHQLEEEALRLIQSYPILARFKYKNFFQAELYPRKS